MLQDYNITENDNCQEVKELLASNTLPEFKRHIEYRQKYQKLIYPTLNESQKALWDVCSTDIWVRKDGTVAALNSCRNRFCAICNWRAARKRYCYTYRAMKQLESQGKYAYLFLTMTIQNCQDWELKQTINNIMEAVNRMQSTKTWRKRVKGYIRQTEVTYNDKKDSYHPHLHYIVAVPRDYFTDPELYLQTWQWRELWEKAMRLDYYCQYKIEAIQAWDERTIIGQVCEISKYQIKLSSVVEKEQSFPVQIIADAIRGRRMVAYGGIYAEINKHLKQIDKDNVEDVIDGMHYIWDEEKADYVMADETELKRYRKEEPPESNTQKEYERKKVRKAIENAIKMSPAEKRTRLRAEAKKHKALSKKNELTTEDRAKEAAEIESELITIIDNEPQTKGETYDNYRVRRAMLMRRYNKLYQQAIKK